MDAKIPSSISSLFYTNLAPSLMDVPRIHQLLRERKAELSVFADDIERARAQVRSLEQQRDRVQDVVQELQALVSPVRRMPTDVMAKIFEHCVWGQPLLTAHPREAPLLLAQICRSWRYLLFSLPCLWTSLRLDLPPSSSDWKALVQSKSLSMHLWFSRSKSLPISLSLSHTKNSISWHALMHLDKEILTLACRLKELSLHFTPRSLSSLLMFTQSPLPYLEHLELQNTNTLPTSENPPPIVLRSAPSLRSLSLSWCSLDLRYFQIPWAQLHHLNLEYDASSFWNPIHSDYLKMLTCCPNLTTLFLGIGVPIDDDDVPTTPISPVTLPLVHTFKVNIYVQTPYLARFFDTLRMPRLRQFDVKNVSLALSSFTGQIECLPFLARCADTLESVCFNNIDLADSPVMTCLAQLHRVHTLSFLPGILRLNHGLVTALACDGENEVVCPALESLHLKCSSVVSIEAVGRLVASRRPGLKHFSLQLATFDYGSDTRDEKLEALRARLAAYVEDGLELVLMKTSHSNST